MWGSLAHTVLARWGIARFATEVAPGKPLLARSCLSVKAAFVQPLRKALTRPPALSCSHKTEEGQSALEQPLPERAAFIRSFLQSKSLRRGAQQPRAHLCQGSVLCLRTPRAAGDPGHTASSARCRQGCPEPNLGSPCWPNPAGEYSPQQGRWARRCRVPPRSAAAGLVPLAEQQKARSDPEGGQRAEGEGEKTQPWVTPGAVRWWLSSVAQPHWCLAARAPSPRASIHGAPRSEPLAWGDGHPPRGGG